MDDKGTINRSILLGIKLEWKLLPIGSNKEDFGGMMKNILVPVICCYIMKCPKRGGQDNNLLSLMALWVVLTWGLSQGCGQLAAEADVI